MQLKRTAIKKISGMFWQICTGTWRENNGEAPATLHVLHYMCACLRFGYKPDLCIGEVLGQGLYFDHSWISLDDKMIDLAISMTLLGGAPASGVIIFGKDIKTGLPPILDYGVPGRGIEDQVLFFRLKEHSIFRLY